jgi:hypothetical protein
MTTREALIDKLRPGKLRVSPKFHAILAYLLGQRWSKPCLTDLCLTSDGCLLGQREGDCGLNEFLGDESSLRHNIEGACRVAGTTPEELHYLRGRLERLRR